MNSEGFFIPPAPDAAIHRAHAALDAAVRRVERTAGVPQVRWDDPEAEFAELLADEPGVLAALDELQQAMKHVDLLHSEAVGCWRAWREGNRKPPPG